MAIGVSYRPFGYANEAVEKDTLQWIMDAKRVYRTKEKHLILYITSRVVNQISIRWRFKRKNQNDLACTRYNVVSFIHCVCIYLYVFCWTRIVLCIQGCIHNTDRSSSQKGWGEMNINQFEPNITKKKGEIVKFRFTKIARGCISSLCRRVQYYVVLYSILVYGKIQATVGRRCWGLSTAACHWWFMTPSTPHTHFSGLLLLLYIYVLYREIFAFAHETRLRHIHFIFYLYNNAAPAALCHISIRIMRCLFIYIILYIGYMPGNVVEWLCNAASDKPQKHISQNEMSLFFLLYYILYFLSFSICRAAPPSLALVGRFFSIVTLIIYILYISI